MTAFEPARPPKPHLDWSSQLDRLESYGIQTGNRETALQVIRGCNYYKLKGYFHSFIENREGNQESVSHPTSLDDIMSLLEFDFQLRAILFEALSKYEQQLKTRVAYHLGALDPLAHENRTGLTFNDEQYTKWKQKYDAGVNWASKTAYVRHHDQNYGGHLPIWVAIETMSLGTVTQLVKFAHQGLLTKIADEFNCQARQFKSWALSLVPLRNATFHHERLWNNQFQAAPEVRQAPDLLLHLKQMDSNQRNRLYPRLAVLAWLDREDQFGMDFKSRLVTRVNQLPVHPRIKLAQMGFPPDWQKLDLWAN